MKLSYLKSLMTILICINFQSILTSQILIDSSRNEKYFLDIVKRKIQLSPKKNKSRLSINDKNHNLVIEQAEGHYKTTFFLDSICDIETMRLNCHKTDTMISKYPNIEVLNWGNSTKIYDYKNKKQQIERLDLLKKIYGSVDSIVSCKELFVNDDTKKDLVVLKKIRGWDYKIDSVTKKTIYFQTEELQYRMDILINSGNNYVQIHSSNSFDIPNLQTLYIPNFRLYDKRLVYFMINDYQEDVVNMLELYAIKTQ